MEPKLITPPRLSAQERKELVNSFLCSQSKHLRPIGMVLREYSDLRMIISLRLYGAYINVFYADGQLKFFDVKAYYGGMPLRIPDYDLDGELESVLVDDTDLIVTTDRRRVTLVFSEDLIRYCETDSCDLTAKPAEPTTPRSGVRMLAYGKPCVSGRSHRTELPQKISAPRSGAPPTSMPHFFSNTRDMPPTRRSRVLMLAYENLPNPPSFYMDRAELPTRRSRVRMLAYGKPCVSGRSHRTEELQKNSAPRSGAP